MTTEMSQVEVDKLSTHYSLDPNCDQDTYQGAIRSAGRMREAQVVHFHKAVQRCPGVNATAGVNTGCRVVYPGAWPPGQTELW